MGSAKESVKTDSAKESAKDQGAARNALVIVESPAKAKTISRYLGPGFRVESSIGHIRDLPSKAADIPARYKGEPWARLGIDIERDFEPLYVVPADKKAQVKKLKQLLSKADELYLATDEDREGEAIAWHLREVLDPKVPVKRMVFGEITKSALQRALSETRQIDERLVDAQEARRLLDRLYGYEVSPILWKKVKPRLSAGRVQSVATRLVVERERARMRFVAASYCSVSGTFESREGEAAIPGGPSTFEARLVELDGRRVATGRDFEETTGELSDPDKVAVLDGAAAGRLVERLEGGDFRVDSVVEKPFTRKPYAPFITSTLQQEAGRKLRFGAQRAMRVAQGLYENGYITYMRTDSTQLSAEAVEAARRQVAERYGRDYLPEQPRVYASKSKNAQEAHEAIRPAGETFRTPQELKAELDRDALALYELIWKRTLASQMKDARGKTTSVRLSSSAENAAAVFSASGRVLEFPGFLRVYVEGSDDPRAELEDQEKLLPPLREGQAAVARSLEQREHTTQPPARFTEASLVKELEERGIGRPSTYASIIQTIQDRGYVWRKGSALVPTFTAFAVTRLLEQHLGGLVDFGFTARMEDDLDEIASGEQQAVPYLERFYFGKNGKGGEPPDADQIDTSRASTGLKTLIGLGSDHIDAREICSIPLGSNRDGEPVAVRVGRYGPYVQAGDKPVRATVPEEIAPDELGLEGALELLEKAAQGDEELGHDPDTGLPVFVKTGRFGDYVQLGEPELDASGKVKRGTKPKMASLWPSMDRGSITLEQALKLLSFPREVGQHPESGETITAQDGRFGPYLKMGSDSRSLPDHEKLATVTLDEAVKIFAQPKGRRGQAQAPLAELGKHPGTELDLVVKNGRFGPYVTDGVVNASLPKGKDPKSLTLEEAVELIAAREQRMRDQGKDPRAKKAAKKKRGARRS